MPQNSFTLLAYPNAQTLTSDHRFCELANAFFKASTSRLSLMIVDSELVCLLGVTIQLSVLSLDATTAAPDIWGDTVTFDKSDTFVTVALGLTPPAMEEGDPEGVEVDATDNFEPAL